MAVTTAHSFTIPLTYQSADGADRARLLEAIPAYVIQGVRDRAGLKGPRVKVPRSRFTDALPTLEYIAPSWATFASLVTADIDSEYDHGLIQSLPLAPNWIGINTTNGHSQYIWYLESPVLGRGRTRAYYRWVTRRLASVLGADTNFSGHMMRNPLYIAGDYDWHSQHYNTFSLYDFDQHLPRLTAEPRETLAIHNKNAQRLVLPQAELSTRLDAEYQYDSDGIMRKRYLFDVTRSYAYTIRGQGQQVDSGHLLQFLTNTSRRLMAIDSRRPVPESWLRYNAQSIAHWTNIHVKPGDSRRSVRISLWSREQQVAGGRTQGRRNVESGHLALIGKQGAMTMRLKGILSHARIRDYVDASDTTNKSELARQLGISRDTLYAALRG